MDFSTQYQFSDGQSYQAFMPIPPLTPSHSQSAPSEEFTSPPQDTFDQIPSNEQFQTFDYTFPGPPTPPNQTGYTQHQQYAHQNETGKASNSNSDSLLDDPLGTRAGSDEDENMTPAQSRRKAQNRAAQRAFRERKERHVKDLETKLASLEAAQQQASEENERLKRDLHKISTENEILRATSAVGSTNQQNGNSHSPEPVTTGPMRYQPTDFYSNVLENHQNKVPSHRIVTSDSGERLLAAGATWDYIISHDLYKRGLVDVGDVSERLKHCARCDGQGPVFPESSIISAIEQSVASGSDDLL